MSRSFPHSPVFTALCLFVMTACTPHTKPLLGSPEHPYPLQSPPRVGEIVHLPTGTVVGTAQMLAVAGDARIVYIGEAHDNPASHRLELQLLQDLANAHPGSQALGMEMFAPSQQPVLDRWIAGELDEKSFLKQVRWLDSWRMDFDYYRDLLNFARENHIPVIALNAEKKLVGAVRKKPAGAAQPRGTGPAAASRPGRPIPACHGGRHLWESQSRQARP